MRQVKLGQVYNWQMSSNATPQLIDRFGRTVNYIRISVTDRCDFRCVYCMEEEMQFLPRAQVLTLGPVSSEELSTALTEAGHDQTTVLEIARAANGRPGLAIAWLADPEKLSEHQKIQAEFTALLGAPLSEKFLRAETWLGNAKEGGGTDELINRLIVWQEAIVPHAFLPLPAARLLSPSDLVAAHDRLSAAILQLRQNSHPRLTIEALLADLP